MIESDFRELEKLFLALGDKTRLRLLALMADGEVAVGFLADRLGESQPKVSRHLAYLRNAGIVYTRRDGKWIYYGISYPKDSSRRRMLETVVQSIAVMRVDGEYVYFADADKHEKGAADIENNIYVNTDMYSIDDNIYAQTDVYGEDDGLTKEELAVSEAEEMDVFLL